MLYNYTKYTKYRLLTTLSVDGTISDKSKPIDWNDNRQAPLDKLFIILWILQFLHTMINYLYYTQMPLVLG